MYRSHILWICLLNGLVTRRRMAAMMPRSLLNHGSCKWHASNDAQSGVPNGCRIKMDTNTPLQVGQLDARCFYFQMFGHWEVKVIRGLRLPKSRNPRIFVMYREQGWNPKLQSGKPSEISRDTVVFQQWEHAYYYHASFIDEFSEWRRKTRVYCSISNNTRIQQTTTKRNQHTFGQHVEFTMLVAISFCITVVNSEKLPSGVDGRSQGLWCRVWSSVHGQRHHVAGDQRCPGDGKYGSNTWHMRQLVPMVLMALSYYS